MPSAQEARPPATQAREPSMALTLAVALVGFSHSPCPQAKGQQGPALVWVGPAHHISTGHRWARPWEQRPMLGAPPAGGH